MLQDSFAKVYLVQRRHAAAGVPAGALLGPPPDESLCCARRLLQSCTWSDCPAWHGADCVAEAQLSCQHQGWYAFRTLLLKALHVPPGQVRQWHLPRQVFWSCATFFLAQAVAWKVAFSLLQVCWGCKTLDSLLQTLPSCP